MRKILSLLLLILLPVAGHAGRGFAGSDLIVANGIGSALDISSGSITMSAWFYPTTVDSSEHDIVSHWNGTSNTSGGSGGQFIVSVGGGLGATNSVQWAVGCCGGLGAYGACGTITPNHWYNVILFGNAGSTAGIYVSGYTTCSGFVDWGNSRLAGQNNFNIGGANGTPTFKGSIAEVGYWNTLLNQNEIAALQSGVSPNKIRRGSLVGYFPLYGAGSPEPDYSGNKNNGTLTGTTTVPHCPCQFPLSN
jgi:hypothetical protein